MAKELAITLNGESHSFSIRNGSTIRDLIDSLQIGPQPVLVELNGEALYSREFSGKTVEEGDRIEIIRMVAGG